MNKILSIYIIILTIFTYGQDKNIETVREILDKKTNQLHLLSQKKLFF